jgi:GDPmannose 4,6-dehydratase
MSSTTVDADYLNLTGRTSSFVGNAINVVVPKLSFTNYSFITCRNTNGILFNHESPIRGETFVTKKIVNGLCNIKVGKIRTLFLGNLYAKRDWGHAKDYVVAMWKMLKMSKAKDYVIATGNQHTVKYFTNLVAQKLKMKITWKGSGLKEKGYWNNKVVIKIDKRYFRPTEVDSLRGDYSLAKRELKWKPKYKITDLVNEMVEEELKFVNDK